MSLFKKSSAKPKVQSEQTGERRQLTVLFYDIVGSTSLVDHDDPEALRFALDQIHKAARDVLGDHGGSLEQVMGDGGMAYFGYPEASEDAALMAVQSALMLLDMRAEIPNAPDIRIGIATSVVILPDTPEALAAGRLGAVGVAPNLAARLEAACPVNQVLVGPATQSLTRRAIDFEPVDGLNLKGFPDVTRAWRAKAMMDAGSRFERDRDGTAEFAGRSEEVSRLLESWQQAKSGTGAAYLIEGEPGIGKSRILAEITRQAFDARVILLQCQPRTQGEALFSVIRMYDRAYEAGNDEALAAVALRTAEQLGALEEDESLSANARRDAIVGTVADGFLELTNDAPLLLLAEDLHWVDEVTLAVLARLGLQSRDHALMVLATTRPDAGLQDLEDSYVPLPLATVDRPEALALVDGCAKAPLSAATRDWIVDKADGNPLFLIELTAHAVETVTGLGGPSDLGGITVDSLRDLLSVRFESAGQAKRTAQIASVLGREYPHHLLARLSTSLSGAELDADLQRLLDHGIQDMVGNGYSYAFRHALVRDVAYDSQLRSVRKALHGKIVDLVDGDPGLSADVPDVLLAEHCLSAERNLRGTGLLIDVAEDAIKRSALRAPRAMLERALKLAEGLAEGPERDLLQLRATALLGPLVTLLSGHREAGPLYEAGQALYFKLPQAQRAPFFPVLWGWWFTSGNLIEQTRRSEVLIRDVSAQADAESRLQALHCGWATLFDGGAHHRCLSAIDQGLALFDDEAAHRSRHLYGHDAKVCGLGERALCEWLTGRADLSKASIRNCEIWGDETAHLASQLHGLDIATQVAFFNHDLPEIDRILSKMERLSEGDAAPAILAKRQIFRGWMAARNGDVGHRDAVTRGLKALHDFGVLEDTPFYADIAAQVTAAAGDILGALGPLDETIAEARTTRLTYWLPELLRRKALLIGGTGAESALDEAFEMSQTQGAQMLALRNLGTRIDLGLLFPPQIADAMRTHIDAISDSALKQKVSDALAG